MNEGDYVTRKSYGGDVLFKIERIDGNKVYLRGVEYRLIADAPLDDLTKVKDPFQAPQEHAITTQYRQTVDRLKSFRNTVLDRILQDRTGTALQNTSDYFEVPGKVLHLDGDPHYLKKCMDFYNEMRVPVEGFYVEETRMAETLARILPQVRPNVLVITGHDGMLKKREQSYFNTLNDYKNSRSFVEAVQVARQYESDMDALVIVAGACQSHFEALLQAGSNFASSPARILIHAMDPVQVAARVAYTSIRSTISMTDVAEHTMTGVKGIGGIETRGCFRVGVPNIHKFRGNFSEIR